MRPTEWATDDVVVETFELPYGELQQVLGPPRLEEFTAARTGTAA